MRIFLSRVFDFVTDINLDIILEANSGHLKKIVTLLLKVYLERRLPGIYVYPAYNFAVLNDINIGPWSLALTLRFAWGSYFDDLLALGSNRVVALVCDVPDAFVRKVEFLAGVSKYLRDRILVSDLLDVQFVVLSLGYVRKTRRRIGDHGLRDL